MTDDRGGREPGDSHKEDPSGRAFHDQIRVVRTDIESQVAHARENLEHQVTQARETFDHANEKIKERTGRDLIKAILIGLALGAIVLASLLLFKPSFAAVAIAGVLLATFELTRALQGSGRRIDVVPQLLVAGMLIGSSYFIEMWLLWVLLFVGVAFIIVWRLIAQMTAHDGRTYGDVLADVMAGGFLPLYVSFLATLAMVLLRQENGQYWVLFFLAVVVCADTGAYAIGLWLGKHPMAPRVSPKKTWEGFGGAALFAVVGATLLCIFLLDLPWWTGIVSGIALLITATLGDLGESLLKRDIGIKDMSSWIPGHGGILDRLDSILPSTVAAVALYYFFSPLAGL